jgi:hypothetical protein
MTLVRLGFLFLYNWWSSGFELPLLFTISFETSFVAIALPQQIHELVVDGRTTLRKKP